MNLMKIGNHIINLDRVSWINWWPGLQDDHRVDKIGIHFGPQQSALTISGEEAREAWQVLCRLAEGGITRS